MDRETTELVRAGSSLRDTFRDVALSATGGQPGAELLALLDLYAWRAAMAQAEGDLDAVDAIPDQIVAALEEQRLLAHKDKWAIIVAGVRGALAFLIRSI